MLIWLQAVAQRGFLFYWNTHVHVDLVAPALDNLDSLAVSTVPKPHGVHTVAEVSDDRAFLPAASSCMSSALACASGSGSRPSSTLKCLIALNLV